MKRLLLISSYLSSKLVSGSHCETNGFLKNTGNPNMQSHLVTSHRVQNNSVFSHLLPSLCKYLHVDCNYYGLTSVGQLNWRFHCDWVLKSHFQGKLWLRQILWPLFCISLQYLNTLKPDLQLSQLHKEKWKAWNHRDT